MRLKPDEIKKLAQHSIDNLLKEKSVKAKVPRGALIDAVVAVLGHHFEEERKLDSDAENLYRQNSDQFEGLDKGKAMGRIRQQLASERDFVLSGGSEGRFSQDKLIHLSHLIDDKLYDDDLVDFEDEDEGIRFFKKLVQQYFARENEAEEKARKKILSLVNAPFEGSREWDVLFRKYLEEELKRMGHS
jgi:hypothetical protein